MLLSDSDSTGRPKTRFKAEKFKRQSIINQINIDRIISDGEPSEVIIKASLEDDTPTCRITAKKSKNKIAPSTNVIFVDDVAQEVLDIPKPVVVQKKEMPMILNTKHITKPPPPMVINNPMLKKKLTIDDITTYSQ